MQTLAYAFLLTGKEEFLKRALDMAEAISQWPRWGDKDYSPGPCLDTYSLTTGMSVLYDWLYDHIPIAIREKIRDAITEKGVKFLYEYAMKPGTLSYDPGAWPNGYSMMNSALGIGALAVLGEVPESRVWLQCAIDKARLFVDKEGGIDGGLVEGIGYGSAAVDPLTLFLGSLKRATGRNELEHPYFKYALHFPIYFLSPGGSTCANFGDNGTALGSSPGLVGTAKILAMANNDGLAAWYLRRLGRDDWQTKGVVPTGPHELGFADSKVFRDIGWAALRTGWGDDDLLLAFKSGTPFHHNHLDQNSFILAFKGTWLANDPGYQRYNMRYPTESDRERIRHEHLYTYGTSGHNSLLVDGEGQVAKEGRIEAHFLSPVIDYVCGDASASYTTLNHFKRHVLSMKPGYFVILDEVSTGGKARHVEWLLHTGPKGRFFQDGEALAPDKEVIGNRFLVAEDAAASKGGLMAEILFPQDFGITYKKLPYTESYGSFVSVYSKTPIKTGGFVTILYPVQGDIPDRNFQLEEIQGAGAWVLKARTPESTDVIGISPFQRLFECNGFVGDGRLSWTRHRDGELREWGMISGTLLRAGEETLLRSNRELSCSCQLLDEYLILWLSLSTDTDIDISYVDDLEGVYLDGIQLSGESFRKGQIKGVHTVSLSKGDHILKFIRG